GLFAGNDLRAPAAFSAAGARRQSIRRKLPRQQHAVTMIRHAMNSRAGFESEYPFASKFFDVGGVRLHYLDEGAGETLLFVHGNPTWSFAWRNFVKDLSHDYRVLA